MYKSATKGANCFCSHHHVSPFRGHISYLQVWCIVSAKLKMFWQNIAVATLTGVERQQTSYAGTADYFHWTHFVECCTLMLSTIWWEWIHIADVCKEHLCQHRLDLLLKHFLPSPWLTSEITLLVSKAEDKFNEIYALKWAKVSFSFQSAFAQYFIHTNEPIIFDLNTMFYFRCQKAF